MEDPIEPTEAPELSEFAQSTEAEIQDPNVETSDLSIDWAVSTALNRQSAENKEAIKITDSVSINLPDNFHEFKEPQESDEAMRALEDKIQRLRDAKKGSWFNDFVFSGVQAIVYFLQDFWLIGQYAQIQGETSRLQPLRKEVRPTLLDTSSALQYHKRFEDYRDELWETLQRQGYKDTDIERLIKLQEVIPQAQDIVSFMVREVYNTEAVEQFKLSEGFTRLYQQAKPDAEKAGIKEDTLLKFWQAHWRLPGINQAFEMLHRDEIDIDRLRLLLKAADIMPGFIEPLINISYNPYTRVDVRRIADYLDKDRDWIVRQYKDQGYNEEKAGVMADFTIAYNADKAERDKNRKDKAKDTERDLTKSDILRLYKMRMISRTDTRGFLVDIGYDQDEADLYTERVDMEIEMDLVDDRIASFKRAYVSGLWDRFQTVGELSKLALPQEYKDVLLERWDIDRELKDKSPSKAEVLGWLQREFITDEVARKYLSDLGYNGELINLYIRGVREKKDASKTN